MQNGFLPVDTAFNKRSKAVQRRNQPAVSMYDIIGILFENVFQKFRDIMEMIIEGITVYLADIHNVLDGNFGIRFFFQ